MFAESWSIHSLPAPRIAVEQRGHSGIVARDRHHEDDPLTALRAALARETNLLNEKELLLQEQEVLHAESDHRLLNGLQMVVSLLSLQSRTASIPDVAAQLSIAANRIATIERVHRRLHLHDGAKTVKLKKYLQELCHDAAGLIESGDVTQLDILVEGCEIDVPSATAISLGFIVSELITNAVKHGKGQIMVGLVADPEKCYVLSVSNDGPGLPDDFSSAGCTGLGLKIIQSLVHKIGGDFGFSRGADNQGARFVVRFPWSFSE
jgi:two-component sensor histidine kinase